MYLTQFQLDAFPAQAIICFHGWAGDENALLPVARGVNCKNARWYLPRGPYPAEGATGYAWAAGHGRQNWRIDRSIDLLDSLYDQVRQDGYTGSEIFLLGFSMGASFVLDAITIFDQRFAGAIAIAGFFRNTVETEQNMNAVNSETPVLLLHGDRDDIVPVERSRELLDFFRAHQWPARLIEYPAGHKIPVNQFPAICDFLDNPVIIRK